MGYLRSWVGRGSERSWICMIWRYGVDGTRLERMLWDRLFEYASGRTEQFNEAGNRDGMHVLYETRMQARGSSGFSQRKAFQSEAE